MRAKGSLLLGIGILVSSLAGPAYCQSYPSWFLSPPEGQTVSVFASSKASAIVGGATILAAYTNSKVWGDFQNFFDSSIDPRSFDNTDYYYYFDQAKADLLKKSLNVVDSAVISIMPSVKVWLVAPKGGGVRVKHEIVTVADMPRPDWVGKVGYLQGDRTYGVGRFTLNTDLAHAWVKAEENAVFNLLTIQSVKIGEISEVDDSSAKGDMLQIQWIRLRYLLTDLRVDQRWIDPETNLAMVLVSAPQSGVRSIK
jgi:hypothetical protein